MYLTLDEAANVVWTQATPIATLMDGRAGAVHCHHHGRLRARCTVTIKGAQRTKWQFRVREEVDTYIVQARLATVDGRAIPAGNWKVVS